MATIVIRNLDETVKRRLQVRAAQNGRSMEAEAREMLCGLVLDRPAAKRREGLGTTIHRRFAALGGVDLPIPPRQPSTQPLPKTPQNALERAMPKQGLGTAIHDLFAPLGGVDLQIPPRRKSHRPIPTFD